MARHRTVSRRILMVMVAFIIVIGVLGQANAIVYSYDWIQYQSDPYYYKFDKDTRTLTFKGSGAITNFDAGTNPPWCINEDYIRRIKKVVIESGITEIGDNAFSLCRNLEEVQIPASVTRIGKNAFAGTKIESVFIPNGVIEIDDYAFSMCVDLESVLLPNSIETIGMSAFWQTDIERVRIPSGLQSMDVSSFDRDIVFVTEADSYGERFAAENGFEYIHLEDIEPEYDFKQFHWGDSREDIIAIEGTPVYEEEVGGLTYHTTAAGLDVNLFYAVGDEGLYSVIYDFTEEHSSDTLYISDYMKVLDEITQKYGEPSISGKKWESDLYEEIYSGEEGLALVGGHLSYMALFELERTNIFMYMFADNYEVTTNVIYLSKVNSSGSSGGQGYSDDF